MALRTLDGVDVAGRAVLLRADLNVPVQDGRIGDLTRLERLTPTIRELAEKGARVIVCSHFGRPRGRRVPEMSLAPVAKALGEVLGRRVRFAEDCVGTVAQQAVELLQNADVLVLENTRFHPGEEANDPVFARELAGLADIYVNDAFSAAHRAHASTEGVAKLLPAYAGRLMQRELEALDVLGNLLGRVDLLVIAGAMANNFLAAKGISLGRSLLESEMQPAALGILDRAGAAGCEVLLPVDAVIATALAANQPTRTVPIGNVAADAMVLDVGPKTVALLNGRLGGLKTLVWNGPLGAFETPPFDVATIAFARAVAAATRAGALRSVAGGGDTIAALRRAGVLDELSYVSTAGGAFLEWLEGKTLSGVAALQA